MSDDNLWALLADQPQHFALICWIAEVPPFALLRSGSKVKDATVHIRLFDVAATGLPVLTILTATVTQHSPKDLEASLCAPATGLPVLMILAFVVSTSVNDLHSPPSVLQTMDPLLFEMSLHLGPP